MKLFTILLFTTILTLQLPGQGFDIIQENNDVNIHLSGKINPLQNITGSAYLTLHRNNDAQAGLIKWNLGKARNLYQPVDSTEYQNYWQAGVYEDDHFKISKYKYKHYEITGGVEETFDAMVIRDVYDGGSATSDTRITFPGGSVQIGSGPRLFQSGDQTLFLDNADFFPGEDCIYDLGSSDYGWGQVYAVEYITERCLLDPFPTANLKSSFSSLSKVKDIKAYHNISESKGQSRFYIDPYELVDIVPQAVHSHEIKTGQNGKSFSKEVSQYGIKYNQLIPLLIDAIQEQQEMIDELKASIEGKS